MENEISVFLAGPDDFPVHLNPIFFLDAGSQSGDRAVHGHFFRKDQSFDGAATAEAAKCEIAVKTQITSPLAPLHA